VSSIDEATSWRRTELADPAVSLVFPSPRPDQRHSKLAPRTLVVVLVHTDGIGQRHTDLQPQSAKRPRQSSTSR